MWLLPSVAMADIGRLPRPPDSYNGTVLVVTGPKISTDVVCGVASDLYRVVIYGSPFPNIRTTLAVPAGTTINSGDRFDLSSQVGCNATHVVVTMTPRRSGSF